MIPESFELRSVGGITGPDDETGRIGITFYAEGKEPVRLAIDHESAAILICGLTKLYIRRYYHRRSHAERSSGTEKAAPGAGGTNEPKL